MNPESPSPQEKKPYHFVRRTIFRNVNLEKLSNELSSRFTIVKPFVSKRTGALGRELGSFQVKADSLHVLFEVDRAVLYQKEARPFTQMDLELHKIVFKLYGMRLPFFRREPTITYE